MNEPTGIDISIWLPITIAAVLTIIGWVVLVWITLRAQDKIVKNQSIIKAYELLDGRIRNFSEALIHLLNYIFSLKANIERILERTYISADKDFVQKLINLSAKCRQSKMEIVDAYQSYRFLLGKFGDMNEVIWLEYRCVMDIYEELFPLAVRIVPIGDDLPKVKAEDKENFDNLADKLGKEIPDLYNYLIDLRIALQNELLMPIFKTRVPVRQPRDPSEKVLTLDNVKEFIQLNKERYKKWLPES